MPTNDDSQTGAVLPPEPQGGWRRKAGKMFRAALALLTIGALSGLLWAGFFLANLPSPDQVAEQFQQSDRFSGSYRYVPIHEIAPNLLDSLVAIEDRRFYEHSGVDLIGVLRAVVGNAASGEVEQGASTITMQLARRLYLSDERTLQRKLKEALVAYRLEFSWDKESVLEMYLNEVYFGSGAYGVDAAAQVYFEVSPERLELWQSSLLAGLVQAPTAYAPTKAPEAALRRQKEVLQALLGEDVISVEQMREAVEASEEYWRNRSSVRP